MVADSVFFPEEDVQLTELGKKGSTKALLMTFIVDVSGSMKYEGRIEAVNRAFDAMIPKLIEQDANNSSYTLYIAIMTFNYDVKWIVEPTKISEYVHRPIEIEGNHMTKYSMAFDSLHKKLNMENFMNLQGRKARPYIMFMTDGAPSDGDNYLSSLDVLRTTNGWFVNSDRYAVLMGDAAYNPNARDAVASFVDNPTEGILSAEKAEKIAENIEAHTLRTIDLRIKKGGDVVTPVNTSESGNGTNGTIEFGSDNKSSDKPGNNYGDYVNKPEFVW